MIFVLADNQDITRYGLRELIRHLLDDSQVVEAGCKKELLALLMQHQQAVVVLDYTLFDLNGVEDLLNIIRRFPLVRWILFSAELTESLIRRLSLEPSVSILFKENSVEEIRAAFRCAGREERFLCHQVSNLLLLGGGKNEEPQVLTASEVEILKWIARGKSVKEIAAIRVSSVHTIVTHKKNIFRKLGVNNVLEASKYALRAGLMEMAEYYI